MNCSVPCVYLCVRRPFQLAVLLGLFLVGGMGVATAQSLTVSSSYSSLTILPGTGLSIPVSVGGSGVTGPVTVTLTGLPSGMSVVPVTLNQGGSGTLQLNASLAADQEDFPDPIDPSPTSSTRQLSLVAISGADQATMPISLTVNISDSSYAPTQVNLPVVRINTSGVPVVDKTTDVPGTITITSADGTTTYLPGAAGSDNTATFHVHGNSTSIMPKLPYDVKLTTSTDLLGGMGLQCPYVTGSGKPTCDKSKSYVLLANYDDKSLLRNWAATALANDIPMGGDFLSSPAGSPTPSGTNVLMPWASHSLFVELYLNGNYEGGYELIEEVKVDSHKVNITEMTDTDDSGSALTGGYLMEIDQRQDEDFVFVTPQNVPIGLLDPDFTPEVQAQTNYIQGYVDTAEQALFSQDFTNPTTGWRAYFDETSLINFYIVNDLMGNVDGGDFYSSDYLYKDLNNNLLYMGPVWDFDISSGNVNYYPIVSPLVPWTLKESPWYAQWSQDPALMADLTKQWNALKNDGVLSQWMNSIAQEAVSLQQTQQNNFARWPMLGLEVWPNAEAFGSYNQEVTYLENWLNLRMGYMDSLLNNKATTTTQLSVGSGTLRNGSAAVLTATVSGGNAPTGVISFLANSVVIGAAPIGAGGTATLTTSLLPAGQDQIVAAYNGDNNNALSTSDPATETVMAPLVESVTNLTASSTSVQSPAAVTLTADVESVSNTTAPTGTVTFSTGSTTLGTAAVNGDMASLSVSNLPAGTDAVTATYSGDNYTATSVSNSVSVTETLPTMPSPTISPAGGTFTDSQTVTLTDSVSGATIYYTLNGTTPTTASPVYTAALTLFKTATLQAIAVTNGYTTSAVSTAAFTIPPTFTVVSSASALTVTRGQVAGAVLSIQPLHAFDGTVTFACSGLPAQWQCNFAPASVQVAHGTATSTVTVTSVQTALAHPASRGWLEAGVSVCLTVILLPLRRRKVMPWLVLLVGLAGMAGLSGCGGSTAAPQTFQVNVAATGGGVTQTVSMAVTVETGTN